MTVVRPLPELSYATGIAAKLTAESGNMVRTITFLVRSCRWCRRPSVLPEEILQIRLDDFDPSPQGVEQQEIEDECSYGDRDWTTGGNEGNCYGVAHECGLPVLTRTLVTGFMPCAILVLLLDSTTRKASRTRTTLRH